jgi:hypothetical protein
MDIELVISDIDASNRRGKLIKAALGLSEHMGLERPVLEKAKTNKYVSKKWVNNHWEYEYPETNNERRANIATQTKLITGIQPLAVNLSNVVNVVNNYFRLIQQAIDKGVKCRRLQNRKVAGIAKNHFFRAHGKARPMDTILKRASLLPFILPIIERYGHVSHTEKNAQGGYDYELVSRAEINGKKYAITLVLTDRGKDLLYISIFGLQNKMVKSLDRADGSFLRRGPIATVGKLISPSSNRVLIIPQISAKSIEKYTNLEIFIRNITPENRKMKFTKAIRAVSRHLEMPVEIGRKHPGEPYLYAVKQELSDEWVNFYRDILKKAYAVAIESLGLPPVEVETMRKALGDSGNLRYQGKVIYSPETGKPLKMKEFNALIGAIEKFLNRNTTDTAKRIVLDSVTVDKLLQRMAKYQSSKDMKRLKLDNMKYRGKTFDWIRSDIKNLTSVLGKPLSGTEMARYQVAQDYVANLVTRSNQKIKDEIKETVLQGIINKRSKAQVSQDLFNRLGRLNRDWKRIADTEIVNTSNLAGILQEVNDAPKGEKVYFKRYELPGCCDKCAKVNGVVALWSNTPLADERIKDPHAKIAIWEGKGQEKGLTTGVVHPNCRGGWLRWGGPHVDAMTAQIQGKAEKWDAAVKEAREEYRVRGTENPNDQTPGYVDRINELYREKLGKE